MTTPMTHLVRGRRTVLALTVALLAGTACDRVDDLLSIETPSRLAEETLLVPANAQLLVASATGDFQCAYGSYVVASGMAAGELYESTQTASRWSYDRRDVRPTDAHYSTFGCTGIGVYTPLNTARYTNDQILAKLEGWTDAEVPNRQRLMAQAAAFAGYSLLLLGEGFCSGAIDGSAEMTSAQFFAEAEERFGRAITAAQAAGATDLLNLARVGRARARLYQGNTAGAATDAEAVPVGFVYELVSTDVDSRYYNRVASQNALSNVTTVAPAYRNLTVGGEPDPRVPVVDMNTMAGDQYNELWRQQIYTSLTDPMRLASGIEAQLILAETRGGTAGADILDDLRDLEDLPALTAAERASFEATLLSERSRWLYLQGTRWYDIRRADLTLVPATGTAYPKGGVYGEQRCWPLPDVERLANPNIPDTPGG